MEVVSLFRINELSLAFGEREILKKVSCMFGDGSRVGLVGDNGAGKTTLLRILAQETAPDSGSVVYQGDAKIGYLPQDLVELGDQSVISYLRERAGLCELEQEMARAEAEVSVAPEGSQALNRALARYERVAHEFEIRGGFSFDALARRTLRGLGFSPDDATRLCTEFSGGVRMRIALAAVLLAEPTVLLLDEPTNHLDSESMEWLERWLAAFRGVVLFVSHDRRFLTKMATEVAELAQGELTIYKMSYDHFLVEREAARERAAAELERQKERVAEIERFVDRFRYKATKARQVQSRIRQLDKMEIKELAPEAASVHFRFPEAQRSGHEVISGRNLAKRYGGKTVFSDLTVEIRRGERVALVGVNGAGKSTLLRLLSCTEQPSEGEVSFGHNVKRAFFSQESAQNLDYSHTVWEEALRTGSLLTAARKRDLLGAFLFSGDDVRKPVSVLSGGEKSRLALFKLLLSDSNFLILDEPTNHLDSNTKDVFQRALLQYGGTLLIVSHDRWFLDQLATRVLEIRDGQLYDYIGNYSYFVDKRSALLKRDEELATSAPQATQQAVPAAAGAPQSRDERRARAEERNRLYRERRSIEDDIAPLEDEIEERESRIGEIDALLAGGELQGDSSRLQALMIERAALETALAENYERWDELTSLLASLTGRN